MENKEVQNPAEAPAEPKRFKLPRLPMWAKLLLTAAVVFVASIGYLRHPPQHVEGSSEVQGSSDVPDPKFRKPLPSFTFTDRGGKKLNLDQFKGQVVLLSFWASWCTPCIVELPTFVDLYKKFKDKGLVILPINVDEPGQETDFSIDDYWKKKAFPFPTFFDREKSASEAVHVENLPTNFLIDREGKLVAQGTGANDWSSEQATGFIDQLLSESSGK